MFLAIIACTENDPKYKNFLVWCTCTLKEKEHFVRNGWLAGWEGGLELTSSADQIRLKPQKVTSIVEMWPKYYFEYHDQTFCIFIFFPPLNNIYVATDTLLHFTRLRFLLPTLTTGFWGKEAWRPHPKWKTRFFSAFSKITQLWLP